MKLKNYTTNVPANRTIGEIEQLLAGMGATAIQKEYFGDGRVSGLAFRLNVKGNPIAFKVPVELEKAKAVLIQEDALRKRNDIWRSEQSERVFWRIIKDWLFSQFSLIEIGQATPEQIFLPYAYDGRETLYEKLEKTDFQFAIQSSNVSSKLSKRKVDEYQDAVYEEKTD